MKQSDPRTAENARRRGRGQLQNWESGRPAKWGKGPAAELGVRPARKVGEVAICRIGIPAGKSISSGWRWKMIIGMHRRCIGKCGKGPFAELGFRPAGKAGEGAICRIGIPAGRQSGGRGHLQNWDSVLRAFSAVLIPGTRIDVLCEAHSDRLASQKFKTF